MINTFYNLFFIYFLFSCNIISQNRDFITVLGTVQDGGLPHIGCDKKCCNGKSDELKVTSLGLTLSDNQGFYIFEASPDFSYQLSYMSKKYKTSFNGIFVTHAHIGHYTGLMYLGKEAANAKMKAQGQQSLERAEVAEGARTQSLEGQGKAFKFNAGERRENEIREASGRNFTPALDV